MAILKCKMCGGDLQILGNVQYVKCEYCGTTQTIPDVDNEKKINLFNRANRLRMAGEFDKAAGLYENIVAEFSEEAEGYWGLVLCNYGIEYVDDPLTGRKIPTCHRASFDSMQKDENYQMALEYADVVSQKIYRDEAREIDRIMSEILSISKNEKPYDIFICYKETDENGNRTADSVLAYDIYEALTAKGYKVFFSRVTLEDKLGRQYEPYIFAALNSAKVMLAVGTKYEYYHAVWVKNEWSRFIKLMAKDKTKTLIPCYKDIDPYDIPEEFKTFQGQDMSKLGYIQDLCRGIDKLINIQDITGRSSIDSTIVEPLIKRANMFLEDDDWDNASIYFDKALDLDPENGYAYKGKLMAELKIKKNDDFPNCPEPFDNSYNYQKAIRYCDSKMSDYLISCVEYIKKRNYSTIAEEKYVKGVNIMDRATHESHLYSAADIFKELGSYKDSAELSEKCRKKADDMAETKRVERVYSNCVKEIRNGCSEAGYRELVSKLKTLNGYRDSEELIAKCTQLAEVKRKNDLYMQADRLPENTVEDYQKKIMAFQKIIDWRDSAQRIEKYKTEMEELKIYLEKQRHAQERMDAIKESIKWYTSTTAKIIIAVALVIVVFAILLLYLLNQPQ